MHKDGSPPGECVLPFPQPCCFPLEGLLGPLRHPGPRESPTGQTQTLLLRVGCLPRGGPQAEAAEPGCNYTDCLSAPSCGWARFGVGIRQGLLDRDSKESFLR